MNCGNIKAEAQELSQIIATQKSPFNFCCYRVSLLWLAISYPNENLCEIATISIF